MNNEPFLRYLDAHITWALEEDIGPGDYTTWATVPAHQRGRMVLVAKQAGVLAGVLCAARTFQLLDPAVQIEAHAQDGERVSSNSIILEVSGRLRALLMAERVALNYLQRLSGIATLTRQFVDAVQGTGAIILDTRKTTPHLRLLEKWAVRLGGGQNHRFGLYDAILIKENHIAAAGGIAEALERVRQLLTRLRKQMPVIIEITQLSQIEELAPYWTFITRVLLDNMTPTMVAEARQMIPDHIPIEVSGGITLDNVRQYAEAGARYISVGRLTHSAPALDISALIL